MFFIVCQQICWQKVSVLGIGKHPNETRVNSITIGMCAIKMETLEAQNLMHTKIQSFVESTVDGKQPLPVQ